MRIVYDTDILWSMLMWEWKTTQIKFCRKYSYHASVELHTELYCVCTLQVIDTNQYSEARRNVLSTNVLYEANGICHTDTPRIKLIAGICLVSFVWKLIFSMWYLAICLTPLSLFITHGLFSNGVYSIRICISEMLYILQDKWDLVPVKHISLLT